MHSFAHSIALISLLLSSYGYAQPARNYFEVYLNTSTCSAHSAQLEALGKRIPDTAVQLYLSIHDSSITSDILDKFDLSSAIENFKIYYLQPKLLALFFSGSGSSTFAYYDDGVLAHKDIVDNLASFINDLSKGSINGSKRSMVHYPLPFGLSGLCDLYYFGDSIIIYDTFLGRIHNFHLDTITNEIRISKRDLINDLTTTFSNYYYSIYGKTDIKFSQLADMISTSERTYFVPQFTIVEHGERTKTVTCLIQEIDGHLSNPRIVPNQTMYDDASPSILSHMSCVIHDSIYMCMSTSSIDSLLSERPFILKLNLNDTVSRFDQAYLGCKFPEVYRSFGYGAFFSAGAFSEGFYCGNIYPVLINSANCAEVDLGAFLGLSDSDIGASDSTYYTRAFSYHNDIITLVYTLDHRVHRSQISTKTWKVIRSGIIDGIDLDWSSLTLGSDNRLMGLTEDRKRIVKVKLE